MDYSISDGTKPRGTRYWIDKVMKTEKQTEIGPYDHWITPKFSGIARGSRLTLERIENLIIRTSITLQEREVLMELLYAREAYIAFNFEEIGLLRPEVAPPQEIRTILYIAWQTPGYPIPKALKSDAIAMIRERYKKGTIEPAYGPYRNPWFLVAKNKGGYRLINDAQWTNKVTIRDALLPLSADEFSEEFAGCQLTCLLDFISGYN
ncbi:hypothetical protein BP6252_00531 [Coleophoma cylindrospora]|uniref:Reverse transcriptase domain-containing protein n=1 Tax=Coleophoma cylindrospora TaxID=1849047 RepID=A0A3D8SQ93_9HELO|nr:hypothetical protein BP6252_00531 [Coleophoma cylindrospora]